MSKLKIYCIRPITGKTAEEIFKYYDNIKLTFDNMSYTVLNPMACKDSLRTETGFKAHGYLNPIATNKAIFSRDHWMVEQSDIVYANFLGTKTASIGCIMELAWAWQLRKHTVVVMDKNNIHQHAFVLECANVIFETTSEAIDYLDELNK